jgi:hypothetical protein
MLPKFQNANFWDCSENFRTFQTIREIPKLTLSRETQKLGDHATLERTLTRLKIILRSGLGDSASTSEIKNQDRDRIWELLGTFGNFWELLGTFGNFWEFGDFSQFFRKLCYLPKNSLEPKLHRNLCMHEYLDTIQCPVPIFLDLVYTTMCSVSLHCINFPGLQRNNKVYIYFYQMDVVQLQLSGVRSPGKVELKRLAEE